MLTTQSVWFNIGLSNTICAERGANLDKELIGKRLIFFRGNASREQVALELGISVSALQMYENGQRIPRDEIKVRIANYYNKTVQDIFFDLTPHDSCG